METEPSEADRSEAQRDRLEETDDVPVEAVGEPEQRVDEEDPEELQDPERHGAGPAEETG